MISRKLGALLVAMSACAMPGPALASVPGEGPIYDTLYSSDATGLVRVGHHYGDCDYSGPLYRVYLEGATSEYFQDVQVGYCRDGVWEPL